MATGGGRGVACTPCGPIEALLSLKKNYFNLNLLKLWCYGVRFLPSSLARLCSVDLVMCGHSS